MDDSTIVVMEVVTHNVRYGIDMILPPGLYKGAITTSSKVEGSVITSNLTSAVLILDSDALDQLGMDDDDLGMHELRVPVLEHIHSGDITFAMD